MFVLFFCDDGVNSVSERVDDSCLLFDMMVRVEVQVLVCVCFLSVDAKADRSVVFNLRTGDSTSREAAARNVIPEQF